MSLRSPRVMALVAASFVLVLSGCVASTVRPLPSPPKVKVPPTSTSLPDFSNTSLPTVGGTTTTLSPALRGGTASLHGRVMSGGVPVGNADVRIDRFLGDQFASTDVTAGPDGSWGIDHLAGGRYRLRAYRAPDAAMVNADVLFLGAGENRTVDLEVDHFGGGLSVSAAIAPNPPSLGEAANLLVVITRKGVDPNGVARSIGQPDVPVVLIPAGGRTIVSPNPSFTNAAGRVQWTIRCDSLDNQGLSVQLPDGTSVPINVAGCRIPPPTTTTTTTTTAPPPGGTLQPMNTQPGH